MNNNTNKSRTNIKMQKIKKLNTDTDAYANQTSR